MIVLGLHAPYVGSAAAWRQSRGRQSNAAEEEKGEAVAVVGTKRGTSAALRMLLKKPSSGGAPWKRR